MKTSILIPTRENTDSVKEVIESFIQTADNPENIDFVIGLDFDDPQKQVVYDAIGSLPRLKIIEFPVRHTYKRIHLYYRELYPHARGVYLFPTSDDALMTTKGWDSTLGTHEDYFHVVGFATKVVETDKEPVLTYALLFHAMPKLWYELLNGVGECPHIDSWTQEVVGQIGLNGAMILKRENGVVIEHNKPRLSRVRLGFGQEGDPDAYWNAKPKMKEQADIIWNYIQKHNLKY